jgi:hypothetical protein
MMQTDIMPTRASKKIDEMEQVNGAAGLVFAQRSGQTLPDSTPTPAAALPPEPPKVKNPAAVALGMLGASKGGKARAAKLSSKQRVEIAKKAAESRWSPAQYRKENNFR